MVRIAGERLHVLLRVERPKPGSEEIVRSIKMAAGFDDLLSPVRRKAVSGRPLAPRRGPAASHESAPRRRSGYRGRGSKRIPAADDNLAVALGQSTFFNFADGGNLFGNDADDSIALFARSCTQRREGPKLPIRVRLAPEFPISAGAMPYCRDSIPIRPSIISG